MKICWIHSWVKVVIRCTGTKHAIAPAGLQALLDGAKEEFMKCARFVQTGRLPGRRARAAASNSERLQLRQHLDACASCRGRLQRYSQAFSAFVPCAARVLRRSRGSHQSSHGEVAGTQGWRHRWSSVRDRIEILQDNFFSVRLRFLRPGAFSPPFWFSSSCCT